MAMDQRELSIIREAIDDTTETHEFSDATIEDMFDAFNENVQYTIAYLLLAKATQLTHPTAPTAPTLDEWPEVGLGIWERKNSDALDLFSRELNLYSEEMSHLRMRADIYRQQAQLMIEGARDGDIL